MTSRIEEHSERRVGLQRRLAGTDVEHRSLTRVEVRHVEVKVHLLRMVVTWPYRGDVFVDLLKRDRRTNVAAQLNPIGMFAQHDLPSGDCCVERSEHRRVRAINRNEAQTGNRGHALDGTARQRQGRLARPTHSPATPRLPLTWPTVAPMGTRSSKDR